MDNGIYGPVNYPNSYYYRVNSNPINLCFQQWLAIEPIEVSVKKTTRSGVTVAEQKVNLLSSKVVFGDLQGLISPGDIVYLHGNCITNPQFKEVFELDGHKFIFIMKDWIRMVKRSPMPSPAITYVNNADRPLEFAYQCDCSGDKENA